MIVILNRDVKGTGKAGEVVKVSDGYARNMLLPKGYAREATEGNVKNLEKQKAYQQRKHDEEKAAAQELAKGLEKEIFTISTKAGEGGKLFGSITNKDISQLLEEKKNIKVDKKKIILKDSIKSVGTFHVEVKLFPEVTANVTIKVEEE